MESSHTAGSAGMIPKMPRHDSYSIPMWFLQAVVGILSAAIVGAGTWAWNMSNEHASMKVRLDALIASQHQAEMNSARRMERIEASVDILINRVTR